MILKSPMLLSIAAALPLAAFCREPQAGEAPAAFGPITARPLAAFQTELLDLAFEAVSEMPFNPHVKNRSRAQEAVVAACLELEQPHRALVYVERIDNWRRGAGYADLAFYWAHLGAAAEAQKCLDLARQVAGAPAEEIGQDWRRDRIRAKIARTYYWLGQPREAGDFEAGAAPSELGEVEVVKAALGGAEAFDQRIAALDAVVEAGDFDQLRNALEALAQFFHRFYEEDPERRETAEDKIKASWGSLPIPIRVELLMKLAGFALEHQDRDKALALVEEAGAVVAGSRWLAEAQVPVQARLAEMRHRAGDEERARAEAAAALAIYEKRRDEIVNIYRAGALRPLAEAHQTMGDAAAALAIYKRAVEEGMENVNSRPRATDLSATCCSMARHGVEPDAELWARIRQIRQGLGDPW